MEDLAFVTTSSDRATPTAPNLSDRSSKPTDMWFCGGDQGPLAELFVDRLRPTLFQQAALGILRRGGVVGGSSAGLAMMADVMIDGGDPERRPGPPPRNCRAELGGCSSACWPSSTSMPEAAGSNA